MTCKILRELIQIILVSDYYNYKKFASIGSVRYSFCSHDGGEPMGKNGEKWGKNFMGKAF